MNTIRKYIAELDLADYEKAPVESAKKEIRSELEIVKPEIVARMESFSLALQDDNIPEVTERMEEYITESNATLAWLDGADETSEMLLAVASQADKIAEFYLFFARSDLVVGVTAEEISENETHALEVAGKIFYSTTVLRNSIDDAHVSLTD